MNRSFDRVGRRTLGGLSILLVVSGILGSWVDPSRAQKAGSRANAREATATREEAARLLRENGILERRIELASGEAFYLLLDPAAQRLKLMLQGATLQDYAVLGLEIGGPRVLFKQRPLPEDWQGRIWAHGELDPSRERERKEILIETIGDTLTADSITTALGIPKTPDEQYPVPGRYHLRYEGGLSLEVRLPAANDSVGIVQNTFSRRMATWWADIKDAAQPERGDHMRLRVILSKDDAKSLYRAMPPDTKLLILPTE